MQLVSAITVACCSGVSVMVVSVLPFPVKMIFSIRVEAILRNNCWGVAALRKLK